MTERPSCNSFMRMINTKRCEWKHIKNLVVVVDFLFIVKKTVLLFLLLIEGKKEWDCRIKEGERERKRETKWWRGL